MARIPPVMVSASDYLTQGFNFIVTLNAFTFGFKEVQGLSVTRYTDLLTEGGVNDHSILVGRPNNDNNIYDLTFSRGLLKRSTSLVTGAAKAAAALIPNNIARKAALLGITALDPQESLEVGPALGTIEVYNRYKKLTASYTFLSLGMTEWSASDLSADSNDISIETIKIVHTGLTRVPLEAPSIFGAVKGLISDLGSDSSLSSAKSNSEKKYEEQQERYRKAEELKAKKEEELKLWREQRAKEKELKDLEKAQEEQKNQLLEEQRKEEAEQRAEDAKKRQEESAKRREEAEKAKADELANRQNNAEESSENNTDENSDENIN